VLRGRFEEFLGPDVVLMWLHLAHPGLCGAALLGNCFVELVDNARAIRRGDRYMTDLTVPPLGRIRTTPRTSTSLWPSDSCTCCSPAC
jgi:hypothetical protein